MKMRKTHALRNFLKLGFEIKKKLKIRIFHVQKIFFQIRILHFILVWHSFAFNFLFKYFNFEQ